MLSISLFGALAGDSLCYAFLGYDNDQSCENAYFKMNNVLIDDRRIKVCLPVSARTLGHTPSRLQCLLSL